ncbi:hypothetical protein KDH_79530 [Dictyobacter sp. S3.2.2.5]|uniref:Transposase DDE domain-containing protein n=1 Tax=Dictyobacter halimunensis TaxID=3026934 RepID=A0ABQ6G3P3_9CHLR|nr:hypothetical protein KDH_79530 [Dictyobacter sp. S3.2.2.5]
MRLGNVNPMLALRGELAVSATLAQRSIGMPNDSSETSSDRLATYSHKKHMRFRIADHLLALLYGLLGPQKRFTTLSLSEHGLQHR